MKFADVNSFDDAEEICGQAVYVNAEDYSDLDTSEEGDFSMLAGWTLEDAEGVKSEPYPTTKTFRETLACTWKRKTDK